MSIDVLPRVPVAAEPFNVEAYLLQRDEAPAFVMVEFGHGARPVAYQQTKFSGERAYVGVEAWLRDPDYRKRRQVEKLSAEPAHSTQNVFYLTQTLSDAEAVDSTPMAVTYYNNHGKNYETATLLPDKAADEVFLSNVFGDPHVAKVPRNTTKLLTEVARLLDKNAIIVLRETITPEMVDLDERGLKAAGLRVLEDVDQTSTHTWAQLERRYNGDTDSPYLVPGSFYRFLAKTATAP